MQHVIDAKLLCRHGLLAINSYCAHCRNNEWAVAVAGKLSGLQPQVRTNQEDEAIDALIEHVCISSFTAGTVVFPCPQEC